MVFIHLELSHMYFIFKIFTHVINVCDIDDWEIIIFHSWFTHESNVRIIQYSSNISEKRDLTYSQNDTFLGERREPDFLTSFWYDDETHEHSSKKSWVFDHKKHLMILTPNETPWFLFLSSRYNIRVLNLSLYIYII